MTDRPASATAEGVVVRADARQVHVEVDGEVRAFALRGKLFDALDRDVKSPVAVGDRVVVGLEGDPPGVERVLPRRNQLSRVASSHDPREQVLLANVDQLVVVASITKPRFSSNRTDRILAACAYEEVPAVLLLTKLDLDRDDEAAELRETYEAAGVRVLAVSSTERTNLDEAAELLRGRTSALYGASGAGKSTLLNALVPGLDLRVGTISRYWEQGRHTTSHSQLHRLPALDARVIDTPGIRVFRLYGINRAELRDCFPEFARWQDGCRFTGCAHDHEPGCAVFDAVERGELAPTRYQSYLEMLDELAPPPDDDEVVVPPGEA